MEITLKLPIKIYSENGSVMITDNENTDFFFYNDPTTNKLIYDGCCVEVKNKDIVLDQLKLSMNK
jgi:hypothetical protein